ncbi:MULTISPECIES: TonB-dependent siderophore receptor [unclassified Pseudomonas]|uniref:TonB-dependent receptor plug domain-containing protein n=1 Tax=unclassified Pseudomonas TaxID=196821 RepID=UPI00257DA2E7|nr:MULTISPECIES: TonB-dependent receptor [unclassified Pseudomonas]
MLKSAPRLVVKPLASAFNRHRPLPALLFALSGFASGVYAQTPEATDESSATETRSETRLNNVTVTGSNIRGSDSAKADPVQVISSEEIRESGRTTVADFLKDLAANGGQSYNESFSNSFAPGAAGIALRNLSQKYTLVLVNGQRLPNYAFAQNLSDVFADINTIPMSAVDRIEVLKDGASSVYGSDAVAGVVNIILKQKDEGITVGADRGWSDDGGGDQKSGYIAGGVGNLDKDRFNISFGLDAYQRDMLMASDRDYLASGNYTKPGFAGYTGWGTTNVWRPSGQEPYSTTCPAGSQLMPYASFNQPYSTNACGYNLQPWMTVIPKTERYNSYARGTYRFNDNLEGYGEVLYSQTHTWQSFSPAGLSSSSYHYNAAGEVERVANILPAGNPYNPFGVDMPFSTAFLQSGGRTSKIDEDSYRAMTGLRGTIADTAWDWNANLSYAGNRVENNSKTLGYLALQDALNNGTYNFNNPELTPDAARGLLINSTRIGHTKTKAANFTFANSDLYELPSGPIGLALGGEIRSESMNTPAADEILSGEVMNTGLNSFSGNRVVKALFAESTIPVLDSLELNASGRADWYSDFGKAFSPKFGFRWQPEDRVTFRGSWSRGFRAPTIPENADSASVSYITATDPYDPLRPGQNFNINRFQESNPELKPERTKNISLGVVVAPTPLTTIGLDYYHIDIENYIDAVSANYVIENQDSYPGQVIRDEDGHLTRVITRYENLGHLKTSGYELTLAQRIPTNGFGDFTLASDWTYLKDYRYPEYPGAPLINVAGGNYWAAMPRWKANTSLTWNYSAWTTRLSWLYTGSYHQAYLDALATEGKEKVSSYSQFDASVSYRGFKNLTLRASLENIANKKPPYDPALGSNYYYDISQYDPMGRYLRVGFDYKFM